MAHSEAMKTAAAAPHVLEFYSIEIGLPDGALRLLDGAHDSLTFLGRTFYGRDDVYGVWSVPGELRSGVTSDAEHIQFAIIPQDMNAATLLAAAENQGVPVTIWRGIVIPTTGAVVADPDVIWTGVIDVPVIKVGQNSLRVEIDCATAEEVYFEADEALGLNDASHQTIRPGEKGFAFVTGLSEKVYWGTMAPDVLNGIIKNPSLPPGMSGVFSFIFGGKGR